jgi:hypothetical protein
VLKQVRDIAYEGLPPDVPARKRLVRLWEAAGESLDPAATRHETASLGSDLVAGRAKARKGEARSGPA